MATTTARPRKSTAAAPAAAKPVTCKLDRTKETKGTYVFTSDVDGIAVPQLYVKKTAFPDGAPESVTLTITAV